MIRKKLFLLFALVVFTGYGQSQDAILGTWLTQIEDAHIEVYKKGGEYFGRVVWMAEPLDEDGNPQVDKENPNPKLKQRPILKMDILTGFSYEDNEWTDGFIYDPKSGETYDCKLWLENGTLKVRGYLGWLYDTKTWTRLK